MWWERFRSVVLKFRVVAAQQYRVVGAGDLPQRTWRRATIPTTWSVTWWLHIRDDP
jgi:hypothetical protein